MHMNAQAQNISASREGLRLRIYILSLSLDVLALLAAFVLANLIVLGSVMGEPNKPQGIVMFAMIAPVYVLLAVGGGTYGIRMLENVRDGAFRAIWALAQAALLTLLIVYLGKIPELSRLTFLSGVLGSAIGLVLVRLVIRAVAHRMLGEFPRLTAVILDGVALPLPRDAFGIDARAAHIDPSEHDAEMAARLAEAVGGAERVIVGCPRDRVEHWSVALKSLSARGEILIPEFALSAPVAIGAFDHKPTQIVAGGPLQFRDRIVKRLFDLAIAATALVVMSPILFLSVAAIKLTSPGPVLFRQARLGRDARVFSIYKFRTMRQDMSDPAAETLTSRADSRVTRVGAFMRRTSIDELPQLFNVLKGDMSIVGPRPHAPAAKAADKLYWEVDDRYWERHCIKPGMTGLAQIRGHRGATVESVDLLNRLQSDLEYVTDWSIWRDLMIIAATVRVLVHPNAY